MSESKPQPQVAATLIAKNLLLIKTLYVAFLVLISLKTLVIPPPDKIPSVTIWLLQLIPLLPFAYGVFTERRGHIAGLCYLLLMYFVAIGAYMFDPNARLYTWLSLTILVVLYTSGMMHVRWTRQGVLITKDD